LDHPAAGLFHALNFTMFDAGDEIILLPTKPFCVVGAKILKPTPPIHHAGDARSGASTHGDTFNDFLENHHRS
jgi:hypothetical protein